MGRVDLFASVVLYPVLPPPPPTYLVLLPAAMLAVVIMMLVMMNDTTTTTIAITTDITITITIIVITIPQQQSEGVEQPPNHEHGNVEQSRQISRSMLRRTRTDVDAWNVRWMRHMIFGMLRHILHRCL